MVRPSPTRLHPSLSRSPCPLAKVIARVMATGTAMGMGVVDCQASAVDTTVTVKARDTIAAGTDAGTRSIGSDASSHANQAC